MADSDPTQSSRGCNDRFALAPSLVALLTGCDEPCAVLDKACRYRFANAALRDLLALPEGFVLEGRTDRGLPHPVADFSAVFQAQHGQVRQRGQGMRVLNTFPFGRQSVMQPYLYEIYPYYNDAGACVGTLFHARRCLFFSPLQWLDGQVPYVARFQRPPCDWSIKDLDVAFFAMQGLSSKETGRRMDVSYRTVENRLSVLYQKAGVNNLRQFRAYCQREGIDRYIPARFLHPSSQPVARLAA
ncbi:PAS domain-containing protein [Sodalis endosymbiont of Spalangia cameroni]|uniref:helix-turn-helix transcriptional regulator n=1 Tax=Sodalis praecaptivus TaxID=1239307 RepID=UPI0031F734CD